MEIIISKNDLKWESVGWIKNKWYEYEIDLREISHQHLDLCNSCIWLEHNMDIPRPNYLIVDKDILIIKSNEKIDMKVIIKEMESVFNMKEYGIDIETIITEELKRKSEQRKDYEKDIVALKKEVNRLLDIENYLIELRNKIMENDFSEKGDKLILNCKHKKY